MGLPWQGDPDARERAHLSQVREACEVDAAARWQRPAHLSVHPLRSARPDQIAAVEEAY